MTDETVKQLVVTFGVSCLVSMFFFTFFCLCRLRFRAVYEPRCTEFDAATSPKPPDTGTTWFGWLKVTWELTELDVLNYAGMDAVMLLKFYRMSIALFSVLTFFSWTILIPVNATDSNEVDLSGDDTAEPTGLDKWSMSNIAPESDRLWFHFVSVWGFSLLTMYLVHLMFAEYITLRCVYFAQIRDRRFYSVLLRDLPYKHRNTESLGRYIKEIFPFQNVQVLALPNPQKLDSMVSKFDKLVSEHDKLQLKLHGMDGLWYRGADAPTEPMGYNRMNERTSSLSGKAQREAAARLDEVTLQLAELSNQITEEQANVKSGRSAVTPMGVLTFDTLVMAHMAARGIYENAARVYALPAPEPRDIIWKNAYMGLEMRLLRQISAGAMVFWITFLSAGPIAGIQAYINQVDTEHLTGYDALDSLLAGLMGGVVPVLAMMVFMMLMPKIMEIITIYEGILTNSEVHENVYSRLYMYMVFNVFLVSTIASSFFDRIEDMIDEPSSIVDLLGESIPKVAIFFTNFTMIQAVAQSGQELAQVGRVLWSEIKVRLLAATPREKIKMREQERVPYEKIYSTAMLIFTITLTYSTIASIVCIFGVLFYSLGYIVLKQKMVYSYRTIYQMAGHMWTRLASSITVALLIYQCTMIGMFGVKKGYAQSSLCLPLPFITIMFADYIRKSYIEPSEFLSLSVAAKVDAIAHDREAVAASDARSEASDRSRGMLAGVKHLAGDLLSTIKTEVDKGLRGSTNESLMEDFQENITVSELIDPRELTNEDYLPPEVLRDVKNELERTVTADSCVVTPPSSGI